MNQGEGPERTRIKSYDSISQVSSDQAQEVSIRTEMGVTRAHLGIYSPPISNFNLFQPVTISGKDDRHGAKNANRIKNSKSQTNP